MDENLPLRPLTNQREELSDFFIFGRRPTGAGQIDEANARGFGPLPLPLDQAVHFAAQINNSIDAKILELLDGAILWLRATIEEVVDLAEIGNTRHINLLSEWGAHDRRLVVARATADRERSDR